MPSSKKTRILCIVDYYLPGFKGGGPIRTVANMVEQLSDDFEFMILTRDRDLGDECCYPDVVSDAWTDCGQARVYYASPNNFGMFGLLRVLKGTSFDVLYLNSFFSAKGSIFPLLLRKFGLFKAVPVVVAPRGEFSLGAIGLKSQKKSFYVRFAKIFGIYNGQLRWQASSEYEREDIQRVMGVSNKDVAIAADLLLMSESDAQKKFLVEKDHNNNFTLNVAFVSRISPKKNLKFLVDLLSSVQSNLLLNIYGPSEDEEYWGLCQRKIEMLPSNISVKYHGGISSDMVGAAFSDNDLFVFPTLGENFGHVIFESVRVGTPVLVSEKTPWAASGDYGLTVLPLDKKQLWVDKIEEYASLNSISRSASRKQAFDYAINYYKSNEAVRDNKKMFKDVLDS